MPADESADAAAPNAEHVATESVTPATESETQMADEENEDSPLVLVLIRWNHLNTWEDTGPNASEIQPNPSFPTLPAIAMAT